MRDAGPAPGEDAHLADVHVDAVDDQGRRAESSGGGHVGDRPQAGRRPALALPQTGGPVGVGDAARAALQELHFGRRLGHVGGQAQALAAREARHLPVEPPRHRVGSVRRDPGVHERGAVRTEGRQPFLGALHGCGQLGVVEAEDLQVDAGAQPGCAGCARHGRAFVGSVGDAGDAAPRTLVGAPQRRSGVVLRVELPPGPEQTQHPVAEPAGRAKPRKAEYSRWVWVLTKPGRSTQPGKERACAPSVEASRARRPQLRGGPHLLDPPVPDQHAPWANGELLMGTTQSASRSVAPMLPPSMNWDREQPRRRLPQLKSVAKALTTASQSHDGTMPMTRVARALTASAAAIPPEIGLRTANSSSGSLKNM